MVECLDGSLNLKAYPLPRHAGNAYGCTNSTRVLHHLYLS